MSFIGSSRSTTYELSRYFSKVLAPLVGNTEHHIRNTYDWVGKSRQFQLDDDEDVVSFDVVSLFTSISIELAIQIAALKLENDETLHLRTPLTPQDVVELLDFCLKSTEFQRRTSAQRKWNRARRGSHFDMTHSNTEHQRSKITREVKRYTLHHKVKQAPTRIGESNTN